MISKHRNHKYTCKNCINLKERLIKKQDIAKIDAKTIQKAIKTHTTESLILTFPINLPAYNRVRKNGRCKIIYCSADMLNRALYIYRDNVDIGTVVPEVVPCPKYK